jgi:predicted esterase
VKLVALGFSQGVATICRWDAASGHAAPDRVICWAGGLPPELADTGGLQRLGGMGLTLVLGERDTIVTPGQVEAEADRLRGLKVPFDLVRFDGGHRIDGPSLVGLGERARER